MKCNPLKCAWAVKETSFLGHWMTPTAVRPMRKKIDAILKMDSPKNQTQVQSFIGAVNFYRSMWPRRTHMLAPFTALSSGDRKKKVEWTEELDVSFRQLKAVICIRIHSWPSQTITSRLRFITMLLITSLEPA